ncbi:S-phase kinase-associated protein 1 [Clonorchis sinensis]|uniref:S-phase kinase-associated protein 1 n=1 Tax=Clonorchis sinensis TaxID=79923 RepID=G7YI04_CLOSI|nr:S-phase kinase-associated protein 1 [Clonorchis sinensis]
MSTIKFASSDGEIFDVDVAIARQSVTIKTMLDGEFHISSSQNVQLTVLTTKQFSPWFPA